MVGFAKLDTFATEGVPSSPGVMQRRRFLTCLGAAAMASAGLRSPRHLRLSPRVGNGSTYIITSCRRHI